VGRPDVSSTHQERPCGVTRRFQITEHDICTATAQSRHVFDEHPSWAELGNDAGKLAPQAAPVPTEAGPFAGGGDVLAGKSAGDEVDTLEGGGAGKAHVPASGDVRPVSGEDVFTIGLRLDLPAHRKPGPLEPERHPTDAREKVAACHGRRGHTSACRNHRPHRRQ